MKKIAIGGGQGFWGDSPDAAIHMIRNADIQYMGCDYLAELTLSIMAKQQLKDPGRGYAPDFVTRLLKEAGKEAWQKNIRICTNAGGMNVTGCVDAIKNWAEGEGMRGYRIGYVTGDDIKDQIPRLLKEGWTFPNFDYDGDFNSILDKSTTATPILGTRASRPAWSRTPMWSSPAVRRTAHCFWRRSSTNLAGRPTIGITWPAASWQAICWNAAARALAATICTTGAACPAWTSWASPLPS